MLIGVIAKFRNGHLLRYRIEQNISQREAGERAGVSLGQWHNVECMRFKSVSWDVINKIACLIDEAPNRVCPQEFKQEILGLERVAFREASARELAGRQTTERFILPSPSEVLEDKETEVELRRLLQQQLEVLDDRERAVIKLRYGIGGCGRPHTLIEVGKVFHITRERARQIELRAIRKLQEPSDLTLAVGDLRLPRLESPLSV